MRKKLDAERIQSERKAHHNKCPRCGADLTERHAEAVKIDECPECEGIWLDKGELEQLRRVNNARGVSGGVLGSLFRRR
ncbi:MAG: zf-TFIIB domain-containing protein [Gemmatimonadaceae bacterium]